MLARRNRICKDVRRVIEGLWYLWRIACSLMRVECTESGNDQGEDRLGCVVTALLSYTSRRLGFIVSSRDLQPIQS